MKPDLWRRRRARAVEWLSKAPHANEMLEFYVGMVELQAGVAAKTAGLIVPQDLSGSFPELSADQLEPTFEAFLRGLEPIGTDVISLAARALLEGEATTRRQALETFWLARDPSAFAARAFTEAVLAGNASRGPTTGSASGEPGGPPRTTCPSCGSPPQVGVLRDDPGALGRHLLVCAHCATEWWFPRLTCAFCATGEGAQGGEGLRLHHAESVPHVRIEACASCSHYVKSVDLRKVGAAEPVVDDLATPELDLWATSEGLKKVHLNLLGL